ncbi:Ephrin type-A receptor 6 [Pitangus sulphuratus]|nr:Ephrin type-A receptor 6 [Pitangus sulphuratus]
MNCKLKCENFIFVVTEDGKSELGLVWESPITFGVLENQAACRPGFYKAFAGNVKCSKCPPHSLTHVEATSVCQCEKGYFRAEKDPPTMACTRPPSAPRNVVFNINETALMLEWSPPSDTGGRKDLTYSVVCKKCGSDSSQCEICGGGIRFVPRHTGLTNSSVTVLDFVAHVNYTFEIAATNGVSELSVSPRQFTAITVTTDQGDKNLLKLLLYFGNSGNRVYPGVAASSGYGHVPD